MGLLRDLADDVLGLPGQVVRKVASEVHEAACSTLGGGHEWSPWRAWPGGAVTRKCVECGAVETR